MRTELKVAKAMYKEALKNKELYIQRRDALLMRMVESEVPNWGNIKITVVKI
jgi:hypothetical protein